MKVHRARPLLVVEGRWLPRKTRNPLEDAAALQPLQESILIPSPLQVVAGEAQLPFVRSQQLLLPSRKRILLGPR